MLILGLTGSIGMGKSTAALMLRRLGVPVHDADAAVHRLIGPGGAAVEAVGAAFPDARASEDGATYIDRTALGRRVFADRTALRRLEALLHPLVRAAEARFLSRMARNRVRLVVLDVPLLFETGGERDCDLVAVVSAPAFLQRQRVLGRTGMSEGRLASILGAQMTDAEKRRRADVVVLTGLRRRLTLRQLVRIVRRLRARPGRRRPSRWRPLRRAGPGVGAAADDRMF
ncbi:MAG: dephospho-CoA kinase [Proteobacteria bacterium]|nr:dephospho-CoA kinase [Pseudomonadota bacterium]